MSLYCDVKTGTIVSARPQFIYVHRAGSVF